MNRNMIQAMSCIIIMGLFVLVSVTPIGRWNASLEPVILSSSEARLLTGGKCQNGELDTKSCKYSAWCYGKSQGDCSGSCDRCTADDTHVRCLEDSCDSTTCEDLTSVSGGCGYWYDNGTCYWAGNGCECGNGSQGEDACNRYRANSC